MLNGKSHLSLSGGHFEGQSEGFDLWYSCCIGPLGGRWWLRHDSDLGHRNGRNVHGDVWRTLARQSESYMTITSRETWNRLNEGKRSWHMLTKASLLIILCFFETLSASAQTGAFSSYLFVGEQQSHSIDAFQINPTTGALVLVAGSPFTEAGDPVALIANQNSTFLFAANQASSSISVFSISSVGALQELPNSPFKITDATQPSAIGISQDGKTLFVVSAFSNANPNGGALGEFAIGADGTLTAVASALSPELSTGMFVNSTSVYVIASNVVQEYDSSTLTASTPFTLPSGNALAIAGNANFLFVARTLSDSQHGYIDTLAIGSAGLTLADTLDAGLFNPEITLVIQNDILFGNQNTYGINADGSLTTTNLNWSNALPAPLAASSVQQFLFQGSGPTQTPNLVYPMRVANDGALVNAEPPRTISGVPTYLTVANTSPTTPAAAAVFEPPSLNFSPVVIGQSATAQVQLYSTGSLNLDVSAIVLQSATEFSITSDNCPSSLAPTQTCFIYVTFTPTSPGLTQGSSLVLQTDNFENISVPLSGTGVAPGPQANISPTALNFGSVSVGSSSAAQLTVTNAGTSPLHVSQIFFGGYYPTDFSETDTCGAPIAVNSTCVINVVFAPKAARTESAGTGIVVLSDSVTKASWEVPISGVGVASPPAPPPIPPSPAISILPPSQTGPAGNSFTFTAVAQNFSAEPVLTVSANIPMGVCTATGMAINCSTAAATSAHRLAFPGPMAVLLLILGLGPVVQRRRRLSWGLAASLVVLSACGGGSPAVRPVTPPVVSGGTTPGQYAITINAKSGAQQAQATATLNVQ